MKRLKEIREALSVEPITASSHTRLGIEEIWKRIIDETSARQD